MSRTPRLTGPYLITALGKAGFRVLRVREAAIISCVMGMGEALWCPLIQAKPSAQAFSARSSETAR